MTSVMIATLASCILQSCGDSSMLKTAAKVTNTAANGTSATSQVGARVLFDFPSFFSITSPNPQTGCAGDAKTYLDYLQSSAGAGVPFAANPLVTNATSKPDFIKNISVDVTDSNANVNQNAAYSCSYGTSTVAGASSCSTFDYGAIAGVPTSLGGSLFLIGGIQNQNWSGIVNAPNSPINSSKGLSVSCGPLDVTLSGVQGDINQCGGGVYALGIETLPASVAGTSLAPGAPTSTTLPISSWSNLNSASTTTGPNAAAGSSVTFDPGTNQIAVFAGASLFDPLAANGSDNVDTWTYNITNQKWAKLNPVPNVATVISTNYDTGIDGAVAMVSASKTITARALFGYTAVPNISLNQMSTTGTLAVSNIDTTERIVTVGGLVTTGTGGVNEQSYKFNPTFGPELIDAANWSNHAETAPVPIANDGSLVQWIDSYHTQLLSNSQASSQFSPLYGTATTGRLGFNAGFVPILDTTFSPVNIGFFMSLGGFDDGVAVNTTGTASLGRMLYSGRSDALVTAFADAQTGNFLGVPNLPSTNSNLTPIAWTENAESGANVVPWFGGVSAQKGFNPATNDVLYFGGTNCRDFMTDSTLVMPPCVFNSTSKYYQLDLGGGAFVHNTKTLAGTMTTVAGAPQRAGIANARGLDLMGRPIIIAWGGMAAPTQTVSGGGALANNDDKIYVAYNTSVLPVVTPTWHAVSPLGIAPPRLANSAMVFSHVTGKFYLFGGYESGSTTQTLGDTYELSMTGCAVNSSNCNFTWRQLNYTGGLSCYPNCPTARRSHRMVEVNYNNSSPLVEAVPSTCTATSPCSYGIFMEGGTSDGVSLLSDRWMFDPTGNGGNGHWQLVNGFPPRHLASMATVDYAMPDGSGTVHRAVLFGGETSLQNPERAESDGTTNAALPNAFGGPYSVYLPPTLGDTSIYDFDNNSWQRVQLLGKGYNGAPLSSLATTDALQAYDATNVTNNFAAPVWPAFPLKTGATGNWAELSALSPPATSGAVMITRTKSGPTSLSGTPLNIPEVFMFGGRLKNGTYATLDNVYKFCAGTTGERPYQGVGDLYDDASCDGYDATKNPNSSNPSRSYLGRWLKKNTIQLYSPAAGGLSSASAVASYMGAGAYDSTGDRILLYGGLTSVAPSGDHVTNSTRTALTHVYEYTPPSQQNQAGAGDATNGSWLKVPVCATSPVSAVPTARYGHTMAYDSLNNQIIVVGGYDPNGTPLTHSQTDANGGTYTMPDVWTAKRITNPLALPIGVPTITTAATSTAPCYYWEQKVTFGNSTSVPSQLPPGTGLSHMGAVFVPTTGYNSGYYAMQDQFCAGAGPIVSSDPSISKLNAGGAYIDIDRSSLGPNENVILNLTYIPMGTTNLRPDGTTFSSAEIAVLKVHLINSGESAISIQSTFQPRYLKFSDTTQFPHVVEELQVLAPPTGAVRQDQLLIPLGIDSSIDRIRVERVSGTAILIDATVVRTGYR